MGVELFFNWPRHEKPTKYKYHTLRKPIRYSVVPDSTQTLQQIETDTDWMGQLKVFLDRGWRLVDICMDNQALADGKLTFVCYMCHTCFIICVVFTFNT